MMEGIFPRSHDMLQLRQATWNRMCMLLHLTVIWRKWRCASGTSASPRILTSSIRPQHICMCRVTPVLCSITARTTFSHCHLLPLLLLLARFVLSRLLRILRLMLFKLQTDRLNMCMCSSTRQFLQYVFALFFLNVLKCLPSFGQHYKSALGKEWVFAEGLLLSPRQRFFQKKICIIYLPRAIGRDPRQRPILCRGSIDGPR